MAVVSNSSPLIGLEQIGQLDLLHHLFEQVLIPNAVAVETRLSVAPRPWICLRPLAQPLRVETKSPALGPGEREAVSLAVEVNAGAIILDDELARRLARELGLPVIGTAGILLVAKERGLIGNVRSHLDALLARRFFLSTQVYELVLRKAGEL
jgi:predicted nucleic acid-binding protein